MFIAVLFTVDRTWKQPRCLSTDEWLRKFWYIYTMGYYLVIKKNEFESAELKLMNSEPVTSQNEISQKEPTYIHIYIYTHTHTYIYIYIYQFQFSCSVVSASLWPHGLQHARLPCPLPTPWASSNSCPLSLWCHPNILFSVVPFSSGLQSFLASGSFPMRVLHFR